MKLFYMELEATADEMKSNPTLADTFRDALWRATRNIPAQTSDEEDGEDE